MGNQKKTTTVPEKEEQQVKDVYMFKYFFLFPCVGDRRSDREK